MSSQYYGQILTFLLIQMKIACGVMSGAINILGRSVDELYCLAG